MQSIDNFSILCFNKMMREQLEYYAELWHGAYTRLVRRIKWRHDYYILPAYQRLIGDTTFADRLEPLRARLLDLLDEARTRWPRASRLLLNRLTASVAAVAVLTFTGAAVLSAATPQPPAPAPQANQAAVVSSDQAPAPDGDSGLSVAADPTPAPAAPAQPAAAAEAPFLFGLGAQLDGAMRERIYRDAPVNLLTSWYNSPDDLEFMRGWQDDAIPQAYADGKALHLVVFTDGAETTFDTTYGQACGRAYPFSDRFASDMRELATIYRGEGPLYISMFTELQTYPCKDNTWRGSEAYYRALKDQYRLAMDIFHTHAPNSKVSLSWGGWQARWDDRANGAGRSLIPHFADVLNESDFQSFQAMHSTSNVQDIADMTRILHGYGSGQVMVSHFKPDNSSQTTWRNDLEDVFTAANITALKRNGLFAFSFMDEKNLNASETAYQQARRIIQTFAR